MGMGGGIHMPVSDRAIKDHYGVFGGGAYSLEGFINLMDRVDACWLELNAEEGKKKIDQS